jgi:hypothetical protein
LELVVACAMQHGAAKVLALLMFPKMNNRRLWTQAASALVLVLE